MYSGDPFLMLAEDRIRELHEAARLDARARAAAAARGVSRGFGVYGWIGRVLAVRSGSARLRAAASHRGASAERDRDDRGRSGRRPAA